MCGEQNSANIIVQHRLTGQLEEEKMQVYVRLGIRLLYKVCVSVRAWCARIDDASRAGLEESHGRGARYDIPCIRMKCS